MIIAIVIYSIIGLGVTFGIFISSPTDQLSVKLPGSLIIGAIWPIWLVARLVQKL